MMRELISKKTLGELKKVQEKQDKLTRWLIEMRDKQDRELRRKYNDKN